MLPLAAAVWFTAAPRTSPAHAEPPRLVDASAAIPSLRVELRYATADNFVGRPLYPKGAKCLLRVDAADRLARAAEALRAQGFLLKALDCYRPPSAQEEMWRRFPHAGYVADPRRGSHHSRGSAVDVTLVALNGSAVEMPSDFDAFGPAAHQGYAGGSEQARAHREILRRAMEAAGFRPNPTEWWHYALASSARLPLVEASLTGTETGP